MAFPAVVWQPAAPVNLGSGTTILPNRNGGMVLPVATHDELLALITFSGNTGSLNVFIDAVDPFGNTYNLAAGTASTAASGAFSLNIGKGQTINTSFGHTVQLRFTSTVAGAVVTGVIWGK